MPKKYYAHDFSAVSNMPAMINNALLQGVIKRGSHINVIMGINSVSVSDSMAYIVLTMRGRKGPKEIRENGELCDWNERNDILHAFSRHCAKSMVEDNIIEVMRSHVLLYTILGALSFSVFSRRPRTAIVCPPNHDSLLNRSSYISYEFIMFLRDTYDLKVIVLT